MRQENVHYIILIEKRGHKMVNIECSLGEKNVYMCIFTENKTGGKKQSIHNDYFFMLGLLVFLFCLLSFSFLHSPDFLK